ncbi:MAG: hypothetical protein SFU25_11425 [Candidatus Caenarcaniphilales bacterium]|nr:hypothetical protein [Candidatus Caenarcaniphilales bacterium]
MKKTIYLSGPDIQLSEQNPFGNVGWRSAVFHFCLKHGVQVINPLTEVKNTLNTDGKIYISGDRSRKEVEQALGLIDRCDFVLSNLYSADESSWVPLIYAHNKGKHSVVWAPFPVSPWLASYTRASFEKLEHALEYILTQADDMQKSVVDWSIQYEASLKDRSERFPVDGEADFQFFPGNTNFPFLFVAPHATSYWHLGSFVEAESFTGAMTAAVSRLTGAHAIVNSYCSAEDSLYTIGKTGRSASAKSSTNPLISFINKVVQVHKINCLIIVRSCPWENERGLQVHKYLPNDSENSVVQSFLQLLSKKAEARHIKTSLESTQIDNELNNLALALNLPVLEMKIHKSLLLPQLQRAQYHNFLAMLEEAVNEF